MIGIDYKKFFRPHINSLDHSSKRLIGYQYNFLKKLCIQNFVSKFFADIIHHIYEKLV